MHAHACICSHVYAHIYQYFHSYPSVSLWGGTSTHSDVSASNRLPQGDPRHLPLRPYHLSPQQRESRFTTQHPLFNASLFTTVNSQLHSKNKGRIVCMYDCSTLSLTVSIHSHSCFGQQVSLPALTSLRLFHVFVICRVLLSVYILPSDPQTY